MRIRLIFTIGILLLAATAYSQTISTQEDGIRVVETRIKSKVYEIKLSGSPSAQDMTRLEQNFQEKQGILIVKANQQLRVCRVEAILQISEDNLRDVVRTSGLQVSKSFTE